MRQNDEKMKYFTDTLNQGFNPECLKGMIILMQTKSKLQKGRLVVKFNFKTLQYMFFLRIHFIRILHVDGQEI